MSDHKIIEVRLAGADLTPDKISSKDIAELLTAVETMIASVVAADNKALSLAPTDIKVGLSAIEFGSYALLFQSEHESEVFDAAQILADAINTGDYSETPINAVESVIAVRKVARKYSTDIELWRRNGTRDRLATVNTHTKIDVNRDTLTGKTTLYGTLTSVGGEQPPRARLRLITGEVFLCNVTERDGLRVAKQLGERLYTRVGVYGTARWSVRDMSLEYFQIEKLTEYAKVPVTEALQSVYSVAGKYYEEVEDIEELIRDLRGAAEEEF